MWLLSHTSVGFINDMILWSKHAWCNCISRTKLIKSQWEHWKNIWTLQISKRLIIFYFSRFLSLALFSLALSLSNIPNYFIPSGDEQTQANIFCFLTRSLIRSLTRSLYLQYLHCCKSVLSPLCTTFFTQCCIHQFNSLEIQWTIKSWPPRLSIYLYIYI